MEIVYLAGFALVLLMESLHMGYEEFQESTPFEVFITAILWPIQVIALFGLAAKKLK